MTILEYTSHFSNEQSCKDYFCQVRLREGVSCKKCKGEKQCWLANKEQFQCVNCNFRTILKSGTIMENSRLSFQTWFLIFFLMTNTKKGISASELRKQLGHKRFATIWSIMHRIRAKMGERNSRYDLNEMVEFDEGHFEQATSKAGKNRLKRGRGSQKQKLVAVMAESFLLENNKGEQSRFCGYIKMKVISSGKSNCIDGVIQKNIDGQSIVFSDRSTSYVNISNYVEAHLTEKSSEQTTNTSLKWVHIAISNAKRTFLGIYHKISGKHLQNYLNEFVYKLNIRYFDSIFKRFVIAVC